MIKRKLIAAAAALGFSALLPVTANACWLPWMCPPPPPPPPSVTWTPVASDNFNRTDLGTNWLIRGAGTPYIQNQELSGVGTPSIPTSYAYWATPTTTDQQDVSAVVRWEGRNPQHSLAAISVRADANKVGTDPVNWPYPTGASGVNFWFTNSLMGLDYEHAKDSSGSYFTPLPGTASYVNTAKFPEGAKIELKVTDSSTGADVYTAYVNGKQVLQGTLSTSIVPRTQQYAGFEIQDDSTAGAQNGDSPANLDDFALSQGN